MPGIHEAGLFAIWLDPPGALTISLSAVPARGVMGAVRQTAGRGTPGVSRSPEG